MKDRKIDILKKIKQIVTRKGYEFINNGSQERRSQEILHLAYKSSTSIEPFDIVIDPNYIRITFAGSHRRFTEIEQMYYYIENQLSSEEK